MIKEPPLEIKSKKKGEIMPSHRLVNQILRKPTSHLHRYLASFTHSLIILGGTHLTMNSYIFKSYVFYTSKQA